MSDARATTFVGCIESGPLEVQTLLLVRTLRRFGGAMAGMPVRLYRCRAGRPMNRAILRELGELDAVVCDVPSANRLSFWPHYNKVVAMRRAEREADTPWLTFVDGDMVIAGDVSAMVPESADVAACPEAKIIATTGPGDEQEPYWQAVSELLRIPLDRLGWVESVPEGERIRGYWNSGVVTVKRDIGLIDAWDRACVAIKRSGLQTLNHAAFFTDQVALAFAIAEVSASVSALPIRLNCQVNTINRAYTDPAAVPTADVLHYHKSMKPEGFDAFVEDAASCSAELSAMLREHGPIDAPARSWVDRFRDRWIVAGRRRAERAFNAEPAGESADAPSARLVTS